MRVQSNSADIGRCGCGRREYCDGSHGLSEAQWQAKRAEEQTVRSSQDQAPADDLPQVTKPG